MMTKKTICRAFYLIFISFFFLFFGNKVVAKEHLYLFDQQINYQNWPQNIVSADQFYLSIDRWGRAYRTDRKFSGADLQNDPFWFMQGVKVETEENQKKYFSFQPNGQSLFVQRRLQADELDFAYFSFTFKIEDKTSVISHQPILKVSLCGTENYLILEKNEPKFLQETVGDTGWQKASLINPRSCNSYWNLLRFEVPSQLNALGLEIKIKDFSFSEKKFLNFDQVFLKNKNEQEMVILNQDWEILAQGQEIQLAVDDWQANKLQIGLIKDNEVYATATMSGFLIAEDLPTVDLKLEQVIKEADQSLSIQVSYKNTTERLAKLVFGIADNPAELNHYWVNLSRLESDHLPNLYQLPYISSSGWQIAHLPKKPIMNWEKGFYLGARGEDWWLRRTELSNVYFCQQQSCQPVDDWQKSQIEMMELGSSSEEEIYLKLINHHYPENDFNGWYLSNFEGEKKFLTESVSKENILQINVSRDFFPEFLGEIYLYDSDHKLKESFTDRQINSGYVWQKNLNIGEWREIYVRN